MVADEEAITQVYAAYAQAFQTLNPQAVLPYYHVPCMRLSSRGVHVMGTSAEVRTHFIHIMDNLKARDYARSEIVALHTKSLGKSIALLSIRGTRYKTNGEELERIGATYTVYRTEEGWKIAVIVVHEPDAIV